jgi:spermidine dehydrogenase
VANEPDDLGMGLPISRRDFIGGVSTSVILVSSSARRASAFGSSTETAVSAASLSNLTPESYPPLRTGLRGQNPGSFEVAHQARDGAFAGSLASEDTGEHFDLVIVGAGISGLAAAHLYRVALGGDARILVLDNHDDFGGHAKRNEFHRDGRIYVTLGGAQSIETPFPYSYTAKALLADLGIEPKTYKHYERADRIRGLAPGVFFDREHFLSDRVVPGYGERPWEAFFADAPLSQAVRSDLIRLYTAREDYLPELDSVGKAHALKHMSYQDFLLNHAGLRSVSLPFFSGVAFRNNKRIDTCPAFEAWRADAPGFSGMKIESQPKADAEFFHFPDGNASIARLLVSRLIPQVFPGPQTQESIVLAPANYARLDLPENPTRVRLNSTAVRVEHIGVPDSGAERAVRVVYVQANRRCQVTSANVILACFNNIIPFIVPDLPAEQKEALHYASKVPLQSTSVLVRNWESLQKLGVSAIHAPNGYHTDLWLDTPLSIGGYDSARDPKEPAVLILWRNPNQPGLTRREQNRAGRAAMQAETFASIEHETRLQLNRMLGKAGFDSRRDILGLTVNRWPHGYAYTYDTLGDPDLAEADRPHVRGRRMFGRIAIANADSGAAAFANVAIDQADRAVQECLVSRGLT